MVQEASVRREFEVFFFTPKVNVYLIPQKFLADASRLYD